MIAPSGAEPLANNATLNSSDYMWELLSTPVEDSTNLTGTQGDKTEATIEGGEAEATKYNAATYELTMNVRMAIDTGDAYRYLPDSMYKDNSKTEYTKSSVAVVLIPEEEKAPGFFCPDCTVSIMESYTAADGAMWEITLAPNASTTQKAVQFGQFHAIEDPENEGEYAVKKGVRAVSNG
jgi:hypothetical protein